MLKSLGNLGFEKVSENTYKFLDYTIMILGDEIVFAEFCNIYLVLPYDEFNKLFTTYMLKSFGERATMISSPEPPKKGKKKVGGSTEWWLEDIKSRPDKLGFVAKIRKAFNT